MTNDRQKRAERAEQMRKQRDKESKRERNVITLGIIGVVVVLVGLAAFGIQQVSSDNERVSDVIAPESATDDFGITYTPEDAGVAPADLEEEPVEVELYEDLQCPACQQFEALSGQFLKDKVASGEITLTYRPFSFLDERGGSPNDYSKRANNAAVCLLDATDITSFLDFQSFLYANQPTEGRAGPEDEELIELAEPFGASGETFESCVTSGKHIPWIVESKEAGAERGVSGTPTVFIGGEVSEARTPEDLQEAIDDARA
ncbi:DsbA-like protein [Aeromicrobium marinum DSM 15272]|uniref:DsbA-like protein n=1 Tax=Aeromicrobium marinum DSM 15272 TaxID=585531 RepID=E2SBD9_9ACTN|nr:thioredoxin domain-containing protein [Aeromicrobium marinum]EFQ83685.1 DsbA-like protein [Aeromicrobium marinum DSM 15272]